MTLLTPLPLVACARLSHAPPFNLPVPTRAAYRPSIFPRNPYTPSKKVDISLRVNYD
jgi:hypothetical protein